MHSNPGRKRESEIEVKWGPVREETKGDVKQAALLTLTGEHGCLSRTKAHEKRSAGRRFKPTRVRGVRRRRSVGERGDR